MRETKTKKKSKKKRMKRFEDVIEVYIIYMQLDSSHIFNSKDENMSERECKREILIYKD